MIILPPQVIQVSGAVIPVDLNPINAGAALAITIGPPVRDSLCAVFIDEVGKAHTITVSDSGLNGGTLTNSKLTFNGTVGSACTLYSRNGYWWAACLNGVTLN